MSTINKNGKNLFNSAKEVSEIAEEIIDTVREPLIVLDKDLRVVKASQSFYDFFKVFPGETIGTLIYNLGNSQWDIPKLKELLETILPEKTSFDNYEVEHVFPSIGKRIMLLNARKIQTGLGKEQIILLAIEDITERKQVEDALSVSEIRYRGLFESAKDGILILDSETGRIVDVNPILVNMLGYSREHFINKTIWEIGVFKNIVANQYEYHEFQQKGYNRFEHLSLNTNDGRRIDIEFVSHVNIAHQQKVTQCNLRDITKHIQIGELLQESEERFRHAFEYSANSICIVGLDFKFQRINSAFKELLGYDDIEIKKLTFSDITHPDDLSVGLDLIEKMINGEIDKSSYEKRYIRKNNSLIWVYLSTSIVRNVDRQPQFFITQIIDITERKILEESLKKQKDDFETIFNLVPAQIWYKDTHNNFIRVNRQVTSDLGMPLDKIEGHSAEELFPAFAEQYFKDDLEVLIARKPKLGIIEQVNTACGEIRWVNSDKIPVYGSNGEVCGLIAVVQDITERKLVESKLKEKEFLLSQSQHLAHIGSWGWDLKGSLNWSDETFRVFGVLQEKFKPTIESLINLIHPEDRSLMKKWLKDCSEGKSPDNLEFRAIHPDCSVHFISGSGDLIYDEEKKPIYMGGTVHDITESKRSEHKISMLAQSLKSINEIVSITDMQDKILFINESYLKTYGYNENELIGKHAGLVMSPMNAMNLPEEIFSATRKGGWKGEVWDIRKDGSEFPVYLSTSIIFDNDGKPLGLIGVATDITERKRVELDLLKAKEKAESASKLKDAFIANMSHEIRTPLNGILGMSSLIRDIYPGKISKENEELFDGIDYSSQRLIRTVDMILNYSRLQVGEFPLFRKNLNLSVICLKLVSEYSLSAKKKLLDISFKNDYGNSILFADDYSITMAISNLLDNAVKYTPKGFISVILYRGKNDEILLDIKDTGIGINEESLDNIFEPYRQEQMGYGRAYEGIGLGLSLVKKVLTLNNASIYVISKKGEGTTFTINFGCLMNNNV
jgi:PAS domain S-box-containing protein